MEVAHIYIYGDIGCWQAADSSEWGEVTLSDIRNQYEAQKEAKEITLHIHSPGGYVTEGFAIHDYIRSLGKPVTTIVEGMCYSIATVIALAGDKRLMTSNSEFMIHNPWGGAWGESSEIQKYADDLKQLEQKVADFYAAKTKITSEEGLELMKDETFMTPETALEKGFITEIASVMKAVALYKPKNEKMNKNKKKSKNALARLLDKIDKFVDGEAQNKLVQDANGVEIDFVDLEADDTPDVGDMANVDNSAAEGEYVMPSGETFVFVEGELTEIKPKEEGGDEEEESSEEVAQLQDEVKALKKKLKAKNSENKELSKAVNANKELLKEMRKEIVTVKKSIKSDFNVSEKTKKKNLKKEEEGSSRSVWKKEEEK